MNDWLTELAQTLLANRNALINTALESAFERGDCGVLVIEEGIEYFHVEVSPLVPPAQIFQFPSRAAHAEWLKNGCP